MLGFALGGLIVGDNEAFSILSLVYSLIALFGYFNVTYVRDFDAIQVNAAPMMLATVGAFNCVTGGYNYSSLGMTLSLIMDSYFGMRYREEEEHIEYNALELFARESWT